MSGTVVLLTRVYELLTINDSVNFSGTYETLLLLNCCLVLLVCDVSLKICGWPLTP